MTDEKKCVALIGSRSPLHGRIHIWDFPSIHSTHNFTHIDYSEERIWAVAQELSDAIEAVENNNTVLVLDHGILNRDLKQMKRESKELRQKHTRPKPVNRSTQRQKFPKQHVRRH